MHKSEHLNTFSSYQHLKSLSTPSLITSGLLVFPVNRSFFSVFWWFKQYSICRIWGCSNVGYKEFLLGMTPCSLEEGSVLTFSETWCFHRSSAYIPRRMKQHIHIESSFISATPHGVISHKRVCFVIYYTCSHWKVWVFPVHAGKACVWLEDIAYVFNVGTRWK